jgi:hypothetical protein
MDEKIIDQKRTARFAGSMYLIMGLTAAYGLMVVPKQIIVRGDMAATASNILANELLFRSGIAGLIVSAITSIFCVLALHRLLKDVNTHMANVMVIFVLVQIPVIFVLETLNIGALLILKEEALNTSNQTDGRNLAVILLKLHNYGILLLEVFWGLWLLPLGQLIIRSGFIPKAIGILLLIVGVGYVVDSLTSTLFPDFRSYTQAFAFTLSAISEVAIIVWLLVKGVRYN